MTPPAAMLAGGLDSEAGPQEGPLWNTIKRQLYRSEVSHVKRLVGESLISQNRLLWNELASLRQILTDFQEQNDGLSESLKQQVQFCGSQHRDLLRRQAQIILEDVRSQAACCGHEVEDLVPELRDKHMREFVLREATMGGASCHPSPPATPSTRPTSSSGISGCSTPEPGSGMPALPLGRALGIDELGSVAEGIREALESEHDALLAAIGEQMQRLEAEDVRRTESIGRGARAEPSTAQLQEFVHKLQDVAVSPSLRSLSLTGHAGAPEGGDGGASPQLQISGGANVRRLQALIAQRRRHMPQPQHVLGAVPETPDALGASALAAVCGSPANGCLGPKPSFDPFFDDPFAM